MIKMIKKHLGLCSFIFVGLAMLLIPMSASAWEPQKPVEFVIMAGAGGGADKMARLMQMLIEKKGWSSMPLTPINKPGGSGAEALVHLKNRANSDPNHTIMVTLNSFYTTPLRQPKLGVDISTFTPVARMAEDTFLLWVHKDTGITNVDQFVSAAKSKGSDWIMAGTGKLQEDQLLTDFLNAAYGLNMKYVPIRVVVKWPSSSPASTPTLRLTILPSRWVSTRLGPQFQLLPSLRSDCQCSPTHQPLVNWARTMYTTCSVVLSVLPA